MSPKKDTQESAQSTTATTSVQRIHGRGTSRDEGARPGAEGRRASRLARG